MVGFRSYGLDQKNAKEWQRVAHLLLPRSGRFGVCLIEPINGNKDMRALAITSKCCAGLVCMSNRSSCYSCDHPIIDGYSDGFLPLATNNIAGMTSWLSAWLKVPEEHINVEIE